MTVKGLNPGVISKVGWVWSSGWTSVLNRTVVVDSDWRFDNLCGSHLQSQSELYHVSWWYYTHFDSEDDYRTGRRNVSHCQRQQSYSGLRSPGRSNSTYFWHVCMYVCMYFEISLRICIFLCSFCFHKWFHRLIIFLTLSKRFRGWKTSSSKTTAILTTVSPRGGVRLVQKYPRKNYLSKHKDAFAK